MLFRIFGFSGDSVVNSYILYELKTFIRKTTELRISKQCSFGRFNLGPFGVTFVKMGGLVLPDRKLPETIS